MENLSKKKKKQNNSVSCTTKAKTRFQKLPYVTSIENWDQAGYMWGTGRLS